MNESYLTSPSHCNINSIHSNFCGPDLNNCISTNYGRPYYDVQPNLVSVVPLDYAQLHTMYHALQTSLEKRFSNGFNLLVAYTFSKNLGNSVLW